jgi:hypothetical protein
MLLPLRFQLLQPRKPQPEPAPAGGFSDAPWKWVPFQPVPTRRTRRRRAAELLFIKP